MAVSGLVRRLVVARAGGACEYCRLIEAATGVTFHVEHIIPLSQGGETILRNLALSCPGCNFAMAEQITSADDSGRVQGLFNPRHFEPWLLGWHLHCLIELETGLITARSATGEATVRALRINEPLRVFARRLQIQAGLLA